MQGRKLVKVASELSGGSITSWQLFPWAQITPVTVQVLVTALGERYKPAYVNAILAAIRGVVEQAYDLEQISEKQYRLIKKVKPIKLHRSEDSLPGRYVKDGERAALMRVCLKDRKPAGIRDAAVIACCYPGGLRRAEIAGLQLDDVQTMARRLSQGSRKGSKTRAVFLDNGGALAIKGWLRVRGHTPKASVLRSRRGGELALSFSAKGWAGERISGQTVYNILKSRAVKLD
jgi:site-specific recombinase XerC